MRGELIDGEPGMRELWHAWDALAVARGLPYAAPAWQLGWWDAAAPAGARPMMLVARDGAATVGVMALYRVAGRSGLQRLLVMGAAAAQGTGPVMAAGREAEVAAAFAEALSGVRGPRPATLELQGVAQGEHWAGQLCASWPGRARPRVSPVRRVDAPVLTLAEESFDHWLARRSANFRQQMRRARRGLDRRDAVFRRATTTAEIRAAIPDLLALHRARFAGRGGSEAVDAGTAAILGAAADGLDGTGRMHVELIEHEDRTISAHLFVSAGEEMTYWLGGFDDRYAREHPGMLGLVGAVEHALARGRRRLDLGPGVQPYKMRLADGIRRLDWDNVLFPGPRRPVTRLQLAPRQLARTAVGARARARARTDPANRDRA